MAIVEEQIRGLLVSRANDNAAKERLEDWVDERWNAIDDRLRQVEHRVAYWAGGIIVLQTAITIGLKFWHV
jgi:tetrahydromethanopterin S-methyltransferase subunit G